MIDRLNRLLVLLVAVLVLVSAVVVCLAVTRALDPDFLPGGSGSSSWFYDQLDGLAGFKGASYNVTLGVGIGVSVAMLGFMLLEASPLFRRRRPLLIENAPEGGSTIDIDSVRLLAERTGIVNRNVNSLRCKVKLRRGGRRGVGPSRVTITCYPRLVLGSSTQEISDDLQTRIKEAVERLTGLVVMLVDVHCKFDRGEEGRLIAS